MHTTDTTRIDDRNVCPRVLHGKQCVWLPTSSEYGHVSFRVPTTLHRRQFTHSNYSNKVRTMPQIKISEIRELSNEELQVRLRDLKQEGLNLRLQQSTGQLENSARLRLVRRESARVMTVLSERRNQVPETE